MRYMRDWCVVDAADYEIVRLSAPRAVAELGAFSDVFHSDGPIWRVVAGYLMLESTAPDEMHVHSHGVPVASVVRVDDVLVWKPAPSASWTRKSAVLYTRGIALICDVPDMIVDASAMRMSLSSAWTISVVHGPAPEKIENRIRLLDGLHQVGGRHG